MPLSDANFSDGPMAPTFRSAGLAGRRNQTTAHSKSLGTSPLARKELPRLEVRRTRLGGRPAGPKAPSLVLAPIPASPIVNVERELGALKTCTAGFGC